LPTSTCCFMGSFLTIICKGPCGHSGCLHKLCIYDATTGHCTENKKVNQLRGKLEGEPLADGILNVYRIWQLPSWPHKLKWYQQAWKLGKRMQDPKFSKPAWQKIFLGEHQRDPCDETRLAIEHRERKEVLRYLEDISKQLVWSEGVWETHIFHGVPTFEVAKQIGRTGFAANLQRTKGWFGDGAYASTSALYVFRYALGMQEVWEAKGLRGFLVAGRACWSQVYPVTQADNSEDAFTSGLKGKPIGAQSALGSDMQFACVRGHAPCGHEMRRTYHACRPGERPDFTELVVREECQLLPEFIVEAVVTQDEQALSRAKLEAEQWGRQCVALPCHGLDLR